jgi:folate-binding protein YgfZ
VSSHRNPDEAPDYVAAAADLAHRYRDAGIVAVEGPDRVAFLQGQLTQDVKTLGVHQARAAAGLTPTGKLLYFGRVVALPDRLLLLVPASAVSIVLPHLSKYAAFQKVSVRDATADYLRLALYGPRASATEAPEGAMRLPGEYEIAAEILAPASARSDLDELLARSGSHPLGHDAAEALRVEAGRPRFGQDADASNLPDEVGLSAAISTTKGCYVGQEVVARLRTYGRLARRLTGFRFLDRPLSEGTLFPDPRRSESALGRVTSSVVSPRQGAIGLGFVVREVADADVLTVPGEPGGSARVTPLPFA